MAESRELVKQVESYVDSSTSPTQQNAIIDAIAALLKTDMLTIETLVREMEMYLTTTDNIIRSRGILLLAELLTRLSSKPLDDSSVCSLIGFFTERLEDWKALHGALVGCLALLKRKSNGMVTINEAKALAQCFLENVSVQSLGQQDRKLCFELLEYLLRRYPDVVVALGDLLVSGICEAIDNEQDPQCLLIVFHIVEVLGRLFPDQGGPLADFAGDIFDILGRYFPIHFTHLAITHSQLVRKKAEIDKLYIYMLHCCLKLNPYHSSSCKDLKRHVHHLLGLATSELSNGGVNRLQPKADEVDVKRDDLSRALMMAFASTPYFEPFAIPLLIEKLSSSLPSSKVEALRYLSHCSTKYGEDRMSKHYEALWPLLKSTIFDSVEPTLSSDSQENEIATEALMLLQKLVTQNSGVLLKSIIEDEEIKLSISSITTFESFSDISLQHKQKLHAVGRILSASAKASTLSCDKVFQSFFCLLMNTLGISGSSEDIRPDKDHEILGKFKYGALYLCIELLVGCRYLVVGSEEPRFNIVYENEAWCGLLQSFVCSLIDFCFSILRSSEDEDSQYVYICGGVKVLQVLATFPGSFLPISRSLYENILTRLMSIIKFNSHHTFLWKSSLKTLVEIGSFVGKRNESEKTQGFMSIVVEDLSSLIPSDDTSLPLSLNLEAISELGTIGMNFMLAVSQGLEKAVLAKLSQTPVLENANSTVELLECLSNKVLPWFGKHGGIDDISSHFAIKIWEHLKEINLHNGPQEEALLRATMISMKLAVANCSVECQSIIINKAFNVLSSRCSVLLESTSANLIKPETLKFGERDEWIISLFASVVIALHPQTQIPNIKPIIRIFMAALFHGNIPAAQALGSILNKLPLKAKAAGNVVGFTLEEGMEIVFSTDNYSSNDGGLLQRCSGASNASERRQVIHVISGLAWIGKSLIMRGHEKIKDVTMTLLSCLLSSGNIGALSLNVDHSKDNNEQGIRHVMACAADAFHIFMSDSEDCLNKRFHAVIRPLYRQRYFSTMMPILISSVLETESSISRSMLFRAFAHITSDTPATAIVSEAKKLIPMILDSLAVLSEDITNKELVYCILLVLSGLLTEKNGHEAVVENARVIIDRLIGLVSYPHKMLVRETAIQCLVATSVLPQTRIFPMRTQVLRAISNALDDPKRPIRQEAVRCRQAWASIATRSLQF